MNRRFTPALFVTGTALGVLLFTQFNTDVPIDSNFPADELQARNEVVKAFLDEQSYLQSRIVTLRGQVENLEMEIEEQLEDANIQYLNSLKTDIGLSDLSGPGLEIVLDDASSVERSQVDLSDKRLVQASDIRDIVNLLFAADAEGIAVNGQRVIASSHIAAVGTTISVNNAFISPPFIITTIGPTEPLSQRLYNSIALKDLYSRSNELGLLFTISGKSNLTIPIYNGELNANYLNLVE